MPAQSQVSPRYDLASLREQFEVAQAGIAYLNHAGMSPLPVTVKQAMVDAVEAMAARGSLVYMDLLDPILEELPRTAAQLVNALPEEIAFAESTSMGINIIANSLPLQPGDEVLLCDCEFPSNVYPWQNLSNKGVVTHLVPSVDGGLSIEALEQARTSRTRVVSVSAVQFFSGRRENLHEFGQYCAAHGMWLIVDAMQAAGVVPLDMREMGIHALAAGGQKALLGPPGQGFFAVRSDLLERMRPAFAGPLSVKGWEKWLDYDLTFRPGARRFDMGTSNIAGLAGLLAAIQLLLSLNVECISDWVTHLSSVAIDDLQTHGYRIITPTQRGRFAHIVTFAIDRDPARVVTYMQEHGVILRAHHDRVGNPYLRISCHAYNTIDDISRLGKPLEEESYE